MKEKKIWIDVEQPKTGIMFNPLFKMFQQEGAELLITARDYDSTYKILEDNGVNHIKVGKHGGASRVGKLETYIDRLKELLPHVKKFSPDHFVTFSSIEGTRIAYGLALPSIGINDEPRNIPVCKLLFPFLDKIITPKCIPIDLYIKYHADREKIIRYDGLDEIAWISEFKPDSTMLNNYLNKFELEKGKYILMRSEPSLACYLIDKLKPEETLISKILPQIYRKYPNYKYLLLVRTSLQEEFLKRELREYISEGNILITRYLPNIVDLCFYGALVISGGGTIVRESSLLNVPSIEYFPGDSAPQETFLIENGFPMQHIRDPEKIIEKSIEILDQGPESDRFTLEFKEKIKNFENPIKICFDNVKKNLKQY
ncbi:MAG: DUF354 domain-containing protein [Promethearchaeota archaeon]